MMRVGWDRWQMRQLAAGMGLAAGLTSMALAAGPTSAGEVTVHEPWVRASLGNAPNSAAYMRLETTGATADRLVGGSTPVAEEVQIHTHIMDGGVARMRPVDAVEVPPGEAATLEPGGLHLMLLGLTTRLEEGQTIPLTLRFENAGEVTLEVPVRGIRAMSGQGHGSDGSH